MFPDLPGNYHYTILLHEIFSFPPIGGGGAAVGGKTEFNPYANIVTDTHIIRYLQ